MRVEVVDRGGVTAVAVPGALEQILDNYPRQRHLRGPGGEQRRGRRRRPADARPTPSCDPRPRSRAGLADDQLAHAFERFWRAPDASHEGSGIGLAIVAHLAATSGGTAALQRRPGGGLDASVTLPRT